MSIEDELNGSNPWANDDMYSSLTIKELGEFQAWFLRIVFVLMHISIMTL